MLRVFLILIKESPHPTLQFEFLVYLACKYFWDTSCEVSRILGVNILGLSVAHPLVKEEIKEKKDCDRIKKHQSPAEVWGDKGMADTEF